MREKVLEFALMKQIRGYAKGSICRRACAHRGGEVWPCGLRGRMGAPVGQERHKVEGDTWSMTSARVEQDPTGR